MCVKNKQTSQSREEKNPSNSETEKNKQQDIGRKKTNSEKINIRRVCL